MDYIRLLETVSLHLFRIRICEEKSKGASKAVRLWGCAWTYRAGNTVCHFSADTVSMDSAVHSDKFKVVIIEFHSFF